MTTTPDVLVTGIVALNGGEFVGRTRLQKTALLLDRCGMDSGMEFEYLHYGPYSAEIADGWEEAKGNQQLQTETRTGRYEMPYTIFRTNRPAPRKLGQLDAERAKEVLNILQKYSDVVLELAATFVFLRESGYGAEAEKELRLRKPLKATSERLTLAMNLLNGLGLESAVNQWRDRASAR
jgi:uncharacterized protein